MEPKEITWSSFLRDPTRIDRMLERGDVVLRRRRGESVRLSRASSQLPQSDLLTAAAEVLALMVKTSPPDPKQLSSEMRWTSFLPISDRRIFLEEFVGSLSACAELGTFEPVARLLSDWKKTAQLHAEGLGVALKRPISSVGARVPRP